MTDDWIDYAIAFGPGIALGLILAAVYVIGWVK